MPRPCLAPIAPALPTVCLNVSVRMINHPAAPLSVANIQSALLLAELAVSTVGHQLHYLLQQKPLHGGIPVQCCFLLQEVPAPQPKSAGRPVPAQLRKPAQVSSPHQPLSSRLGPQPATIRRQSQTPATDQVRASCTMIDIGCC